MMERMVLILTRIAEARNSHPDFNEWFGNTVQEILFADECDAITFGKCVLDAIADVSIEELFSGFTGFDIFDILDRWDDELEYRKEKEAHE